MTRALAGLLVGRTLADRYDIEELIGRGGMSLVYRARDRRLHRPVAVKVVSLPSASAEDHQHLRERLRREAAAAARVPPHPNVVQVYDYGTDLELDLDFIAMELLDGRDLKSILQGGALEYEFAIRIVREAARGLAAGHRAGVVHRDVKPANILVTGGGVGGSVKLLDFGIAKMLEALEDDLTRTGHAPHSPAYASPEQLRPGERVTPRSDIYQLGLVAFELLAGERAEGGRVTAGPRWEAVPEPVRRVVETALRPNPEERYGDGAEFAEAFSRAADADDRTVFLPPPPHASSDDADTLFDAGAQVTPPAARAEISTPGRARAPRRRAGGRLLGVLIAALLLVLALRAAGRLGMNEAPRANPAIGTDLEALNDEFRGLMEEAHENLTRGAVEPTPR